MVSEKKSKMWKVYADDDDDGRREHAWCHKPTGPIGPGGLRDDGAAVDDDATDNDAMDEDAADNASDAAAEAEGSSD